MSVPRKAESWTAVPGLQEYLQQVVTGGVDTQLLRSWTRTKGMYSAMDTIEWQTGLKIILCDRCGLACFACCSTSVYVEAFQVCDLCRPLYEFCTSCNTLILAEDLRNPTHEHEAADANGELFDNEEEENASVAGYEADIIDMKGNNFFITKGEERCPRIRYFGVELEVEKILAGPPKLDERVLKTIRKDFFLLMHDGSLSKKGKGGFEIVTMPASLKYHQGGVWDTFFQYCAPFFEQAPATTSLHIHFGTNSVTEGVLGKFGQFINDPVNTEFLANIAHRDLGVPNPNGKVYMNLYPDQKAASVIRLKAHDSSCPWHPRNIRISNRYALAPDRSVQMDVHGHPIIASLKGSDITVRRACKCRAGHYLVDNHYSAFNLHTKRPTAELRIFRGVVKKDFLFAALEFTDALIDFCTNVPPSELHFQRFLTWCENQRRAYPNLTKLLMVRGWLEPPKIRHNLELEASMAYANA